MFPIVFPSVNTGALSHDERINLADKKYAAKEHRRKKIWIRFEMRSGENLFTREAKRSLEFGSATMQLKHFDELLLLRICG